MRVAVVLCLSMSFYVFLCFVSGEFADVVQCCISGGFVFAQQPCFALRACGGLAGLEHAINPRAQTEFPRDIRLEMMGKG